MRKFMRQITPFLAAAMFLTACGGASSGDGKTADSSVSADTGAEQTAQTEKIKETIHVATAQQPPSLDCHKNSTSSVREMTRGLLYEQLVTLNANSEPVPELCESYEMSDDNKTVTFHLRKGVKFHDGSEMTADDVVASMNRWINGFSTARAAVGEGAEFEKVDDYTVKITSESSLLLFPTVIAGATQPAVITTAAACANEDGNGYMTEYIGTGPYKLAEWQQDQYIKFERFDDYVPYGEEGREDDGWSSYKTAPTKYIEYDFVKEPTTREAGLETGQYDFMYNVPSDDQERIDGTDGIKTLTAPSGGVALVFNKKEGIGTDENFRKALNAYLDCDVLLTANYGENGYVLDSNYMDEDQPFWLTDAGSENYNQKDEAKAKEYLADSAYDGTPVRILCSSMNGFDNIGVALQEELKGIDVASEIESVDWPTFTDYRKDSSRYDIYITGFGATPLPTLKLYFGASYPGWMTDETLTGYLNDITNASDMDAAKATWEEAQAYCWNEYVPIINMGHRVAFFGSSDKLTGLNTYNGMHFWNAAVAE